MQTCTQQKDQQTTTDKSSIFTYPQELHITCGRGTAWSRSSLPQLQVRVHYRNIQQESSTSLQSSSMKSDTLSKNTLGVAKLLRSDLKIEGVSGDSACSAVCCGWGSFSLDLQMDISNLKLTTYQRYQNRMKWTIRVSSLYILLLLSNAVKIMHGKKTNNVCTTGMPHQVFALIQGCHLMELAVLANLWNELSYQNQPYWYPTELIHAHPIWTLRIKLFCWLPHPFRKLGRLVLRIIVNRKGILLPSTLQSWGNWTLSS